MSPTSKRRASWLGWVVALLLLVATGVMWLERQFIVDTIQYHQFTPTSQVTSMTERLKLTDEARFTFYASHPAIESKEKFNQYCERREASSPILGCYGSGRIYIYNVTDERLDGMKEVTAVHELLHAVYERMSEAEKKELEPLLNDAYERLADNELRDRMKYYEQNEPGEHYNELHSILPTEYADIGDELNEYYKKYLTDRQTIVDLHGKVDAQFTKLSTEANELVKQIEGLASAVNANTERYNSGVAALNEKVSAFNVRANQAGGFSSQAEFFAARAVLESERSQLDTLRAQVNADITTYRQLIERLDAINTQTESLNESIDSVLSDEPEI